MNALKNTGKCQVRHWYQEEDPNLATDALIEAYVSGAVNAPLHVLVASGLGLSPQGNTFSRSLDMMKGVALDYSEPIPLENQEKKMEALWEKITQEGGSSACEANAEEFIPCPDIVLPLALQLYIGCELAKLKWEPIKLGVEKAVFDKVGGVFASMIRATPGTVVDFDGQYEWSIALVLSGRFLDNERQYMRGQVFIGRRGHSSHITVTEDCLCYNVWSG